jgi:hypothetical protein
MRAKEFLSEKAVQSTWISNISYNRPNKVLTMQLSNGKVYSIPNVTRTTFEKWLKSASKGRFFHQNIKGKYNSPRIKE